MLTQFEHLRYRASSDCRSSTRRQGARGSRAHQRAGARDGKRPIVFSTLVDPTVSGAIARRHEAFVLDMFETFVEPLERELGIEVEHTDRPLARRSAEHRGLQRPHRGDQLLARARRRPVGQEALAGADVILVGVIRCGKTPTSLYLAMQYGIKAANYPLIPEDFERGQLPSALPQHKDKIFGLSISPERLAEVRHERRPNSRYAALENCRNEVDEAEPMMRREGIRWLSSTTSRSKRSRRRSCRKCGWSEVVLSL